MTPTLATDTTVRGASTVIISPAALKASVADLAQRRPLLVNARVAVRRGVGRLQRAKRPLGRYKCMEPRSDRLCKSVRLGEEFVGALPPLGDSGAEVFGGVDGPQECGADAFDDDCVGGGFGVEVGPDASVGLPSEHGGEGVGA